MSEFSWDRSFETIFRDTYIHGLDVVLESEGDFFSYRVSNGEVEFV